MNPEDMNPEDKDKGWYEMMAQIQWPDARETLAMMQNSSDNDPNPSYVGRPVLVDPNDFVELQDGLM